jgi:hypothetical protein
MRRERDELLHLEPDNMLLPCLLPPGTLLLGEMPTATIIDVSHTLSLRFLPDGFELAHRAKALVGVTILRRFSEDFIEGPRDACVTRKIRTETSRRAWSWYRSNRLDWGVVSCAKTSESLTHLGIWPMGPACTDA